MREANTGQIALSNMKFSRLPEASAGRSLSSSLEADASLYFSAVHR
ncbi:MAG: hypothetical protein M3R59_04550 [Verrucomicrobiota bacterium]|nr:hypothetical protein [Verrucomicrobiota bacterium]